MFLKFVHGQTEINQRRFVSPSETEFAMFSRTVFIVFAVNFIFCGSGMVTREDVQGVGVLEPAMKCYKAANDVAHAVMGAMGGHPASANAKIK